MIYEVEQSLKIFINKKSLIVNLKSFSRAIHESPYSVRLCLYYFTSLCLLFGVFVVSR
jgi:hypothetical protein